MSLLTRTLILAPMGPEGEAFRLDRGLLLGIYFDPRQDSPEPPGEGFRAPPWCLSTPGIGGRIPQDPAFQGLVTILQPAEGFNPG